MKPDVGADVNPAVVDPETTNRRSTLGIMSGLGTCCPTWFKWFT